jgi:hypothetical protein
MKKFKIFLLLTGIIITGCAFGVMAQNRSENTSSARAVYGHRSIPKSKIRAKNKQKVDWHLHYKPAKGTTRGSRADAWIRRKNSARS